MQTRSPCAQFLHINDKRNHSGWLSNPHCILPSYIRSHLLTDVAQNSNIVTHVTPHREMHQHIEGLFDVDLVGTLIERIPWKEVTWKTGRKLPRLVQSMDVDTLITLVPEIVEVVSFIRDNYGKIENVWMNQYRNGSDWCPYHKDSYNCKVITLSLGSTRTFMTKEDVTGRETSHVLKNGDLFVFDEEFNKSHQHSIPKHTRTHSTAISPRVSLVFFCK